MGMGRAMSEHSDYRDLITRLMNSGAAPHTGWQNAQQLEMPDEHVAIVLRAVPELFPDGLKLAAVTLDEVATAFDHSDFTETDRKLGVVFGALLREAARQYLFSDLQDACWERNDREYEAHRIVATQVAIDRAYADGVSCRYAGAL